SLSPPERTSRQFMGLLVALLLISTPIQLYMWTINSLSHQLDLQLKDMESHTATLYTQYQKLLVESQSDSKGPSSVTKAISDLTAEARHILNLSEVGFSHSRMLQCWMLPADRTCNPRYLASRVLALKPEDGLLANAEALALETIKVESQTNNEIVEARSKAD